MRGEDREGRAGWLKKVKSPDDLEEALAAGADALTEGIRETGARGEGGG
jgi:hypothetical protein